jgi:hypothetical protein
MSVEGGTGWGWAVRYMSQQFCKSASKAGSKQARQQGRESLVKVCEVTHTFTRDSA